VKFLVQPTIFTHVRRRPGRSWCGRDGIRLHDRMER
jgi:hypothetical protein